MFTEIFSDSLKIDETLERKLGCLLTDLSLEEEFPELHSLLKEPIFPSRDKPKHSRLCTTDPILVEEWKSMLDKLHSVNQDRIKLRKLLIHLLALIAKGSVAEPNFSAFLARSQNLNYELTKTFLEKERQKTETLTEVVQKQEKEIQMQEKEDFLLNKEATYFNPVKKKNKKPQLRQRSSTPKTGKYKNGTLHLDKSLLSK